MISDLLAENVQALHKFFVELIHLNSFIHSFIHQGGGWLLAVFRRAFQPIPPALRPRHGPVRNSPLTLGLVLYVYRA